MATAKPRLADTFDVVLLDVLRVSGWKQRELAARLQISPKTLGRYLRGASTPPVGKRHGFVHGLRELDAALLRRVSVSLGLSDDFATGLPRPARDPDVLRKALEAAADDVAERLDTGPVRVRRALTVFLAHLVEAGLDASTAHALLAGR